jgi:REP element-mobilizing transposase RayT
MRQLRKLGRGVWYEVRTRINNREPLFRRVNALVLFAEVFRETMLRFAFKVRGLRLEEDCLSFYIKPDDGLELPAIMKRMKQVFAQRFNRMDGRTGHIWGDRYWSRILEGEPVVEIPAKPAGNGENGGNGDRPCGPGKTAAARFFLIFPFPLALSPG